MKINKIYTLLIGIILALTIFMPNVFAQDNPATNIQLTRDHAGLRRTEYNEHPEFVAAVSVSPSDSDSEIVWESEDPDFVSITPVPGQPHEAIARVESWPKAMTVIKAYSKDNPQIHDSMTVTVVSSRNDDVREVRRLYGELNEGETFEVQQDLASELGTDNISFETTDSSIASVDGSGLVKANAAGVATIKAFNSDKTAYQSNVIRVLGSQLAAVPNQETTQTKDVKATGLTLSHDHIGLCREENDKFPTAVVEAQLTPVDANSEICWESGNNDLAIVTPVEGNPTEAIIKVVGWPASLTNITAYVKDQPEIRDSLDLVVISRRNDDVRLVHELYRQIEKGKECNLESELIADIQGDEIAWSSSDDSVATVDQKGNIKTYSPGTAKIQALSKTENIAQQWIMTVASFEPTGISLDKQTINLCRDENNPNPTADITATLTPDGTEGKVCWKSDDTGLATVTPVEGDSTKATIKVVGWPASMTTITAYIDGHPEINATAKLVVASRRNEDVKLVQQKKEELVKGSECNLIDQLDYQLQGDDIVWSCNNSSVVSVTNGLVKAAKTGTATIKALNQDKNIAQQWDIIVVAPKVEKVTLNKDSVELEEGETVSIEATVSPEDATDKNIAWSSENSQIATVNNGTVKAVEAGTTSIKATAGDKTAECKVTVKAVEKTPSVVEDKKEDKPTEKEVEVKEESKAQEPEEKKVEDKKSEDTPAQKAEESEKQEESTKKDSVESNQKVKDNQEIVEETKQDTAVPKVEEETKKDPVESKPEASESQKGTVDTDKTEPEKDIDDSDLEVVEPKEEVTDPEPEKVADPEPEADEVEQEVVIPEKEITWPEMPKVTDEEQSGGLGGSIVIPSIAKPTIPTNPLVNPSASFDAFDSETDVVPVVGDQDEIEDEQVKEEVVEQKPVKTENPVTTIDKDQKQSEVIIPTQEPEQTKETSEAVSEKETTETKVEKETKTYRLFNPALNEHIFTTDENEVANLKKSGWKDEGTSWNSPATGEPVYRLYSPVTKEHHYTKDTNEVKVLSENGWSVDNEGESLFYSGGDEPIYRLYNEGTQRHHLTNDESEYKALQNQGWNAEGVALYSLS